MVKSAMRPFARFSLPMGEYLARRFQSPKISAESFMPVQIFYHGRRLNASIFLGSQGNLVRLMLLFRPHDMDLKRKGGMIFEKMRFCATLHILELKNAAVSASITPAARAKAEGESLRSIDKERNFRRLCTSCTSGRAQAWHRFG